MLDIQPLRDIIKLSLQSCYVKNPPQDCTPVSLLLVAPPEHAKTLTLQTEAKELILKQKILYTTDITAHMLAEKYLTRIKSKEIRTIVIPDLLNCLQKQRYTRKSFENFIKSLIEEGIVSIETAKTYFTSREPVKCNIITATTVADFRSFYNYWKNIGLLSRFLVFSYRYTELKRKKIFDYILSKEYENEKPKKEQKNHKIKTKETAVEWDKDTVQPLVSLAQRISDFYSSQGFRPLKKLILLAQANALLHSRKEVTEEDVEKIFELSNWLNFDFNPL